MTHGRQGNVKIKGKHTEGWMWEQEGNNTWTRTTNVSSRQDRERTQTLRRDAEDRTQRQDKDRLDMDHVK